MRPPSAEECLPRIDLVTSASARLLADNTDIEVGGRLVPTPSFEDIEDIEPPELCNDLWDRPINTTKNSSIICITIEKSRGTVTCFC